MKKQIIGCCSDSSNKLIKKIPKMILSKVNYNVSRLIAIIDLDKDNLDWFKKLENIFSLKLEKPNFIGSNYYIDLLKIL